MPRRNTVLATDQTYHVFNKTIDGKRVFSDKRDLQRVIECLWYYRFASTPVPLSRYLVLSSEARTRYHNHLIDSPTLASVYAFCLMPNHFHLLLKQRMDGGISKFLSNFQNGFTGFFNLKNERLGNVFLRQFKAVRIETEEQLVHVSRYIHLNPFTARMFPDLSSLYLYKWSSFPDYAGSVKNLYKITEKEVVLNLFSGNEDKYCEFVCDNAGYQRQLGQIGHLVFE